MKKKIIALCCAVAVLATALVGVTLAYFTSRDNETNTFTVGGVKIDLIEKERKYDEDGNLLTELGDFTQNKVLMPIVGSAQGEKDIFGMPTAGNYVDKMITVTNTGKSDAWVRVYFAIPSDLDDGFEEGFNASMNTLHFNFGNYQAENGNWYTTYNTKWLWGSEAQPDHGGWNYFETEINGVMYNVYYADYYQPLAKDATTERFVDGVYLDQNVDMQDGEYIDPRFPDADLRILLGNVYCPVFAIACQAAGFDNAVDAFNAAYGSNFNPWATTTNE